MPRRFSEIVGRDLTARLFEVLPDAANELATRRLVLPQMSIVVSNVRGPDVPLFMAGARLVSFAPVSIAFDGLGLNVTGFSYHGTLWICAVACRDMLPDPAFFAECMRESFADLERAAAAALTTPAVAAIDSARPKAVRKRAGAARKAPAKPTPAGELIFAWQKRNDYSGCHAAGPLATLRNGDFS